MPGNEHRGGCLLIGWVHFQKESSKHKKKKLKKKEGGKIEYSYSVCFPHAEDNNVNGSDFVLEVRAEADIATFQDPEKHHLIKITGPVVLVILRRLFSMRKTTTAK